MKIHHITVDIGGGWQTHAVNVPDVGSLWFVIIERAIPQRPDESDEDYEDSLDCKPIIRFDHQRRAWYDTVPGLSSGGIDRLMKAIAEAP